MRFTFFIIALVSFIASTSTSPIDDDQIKESKMNLAISDDSELEFTALGPKCQPRPCDEYCKLIGHVYGRCQFGNCHCKDK
ncbi:unnamed protein product [Chironomus riparius]|uniref:Uncharacterized protein n=1 Tax=Chironomus riparius TaxID=315576 RepID=A0A9N9WX95_9DIPT|nr:unnamed protein product [Chironomus riparius]